MKCETDVGKMNQVESGQTWCVALYFARSQNYEDILPFSSHIKHLAKYRGNLASILNVLVISIWHAYR